MPTLNRFKLTSKYAGVKVKHAQNQTNQPDIPPSPNTDDKVFEVSPSANNVRNLTLSFEWENTQRITLEHGTSLQDVQGWFLADVDVRIFAFHAEEDCLLGTATIQSEDAAGAHGFSYTIPICLTRLNPPPPPPLPLPPGPPPAPPPGAGSHPRRRRRGSSPRRPKR